MMAGVLMPGGTGYHAYNSYGFKNNPLGDRSVLWAGKNWYKPKKP